MTPDQAHTLLRKSILSIDHHFSGLRLPMEKRSALVIGCLDTTIEHQAAISLLYEAGLLGSMFALLRPPFESLVRGLWLLRCASEAEIDAFMAGNVKQKFESLILQVEKALNLQGSALSVVFKRAWAAMNGFTHTGFNQVARRHAPGEVRANYSVDEVRHCLVLAGWFGIVAAGQLAELAGRQDLAQMAAELMNGYSGGL